MLVHILAEKNEKIRIERITKNSIGFALEYHYDCVGVTGQLDEIT